MSAISLKSITGITSITTPAGVDNQLTLHTNDTTQRVKVTQSGIEVVGVATFQDIDVDGHTNLDNVSIAGVTTTTGNLNVTDGRIFIAHSSGPQLRINSSVGDSSSTRFILGLATITNGFINGAQSNDACIVAPQEVKFGIGNNLKFRITSTYLIPNVDLIPSANNIRSLGNSNYRWSDLYSVDANISGDLDVDGHTNLDNVSIAGVTTAGNLSGSNANFTGELTVAEMVGHTGDTHTKLSFPANDTIAFTTGGTEKLRITSGGRIGIGTDNPGSEVHLQSVAPVIKVDATNNQSGLRIDILGQSGGGNNQLFRVLRDSITKLQLNDDGDLVITGDDNAELKLKAGAATGNGIIAFLNSSGTTKGNIFYDTDDNFMVFKTNGTASSNERLRITSDGNITINENLAVGGSHPWSVTGGNYGNISISGGDANSSGFLNLGNGAATNNADFDLARIKFFNGGTEVATIKATTATSDNGDADIKFFTKKAGSGAKEILRIRNDGFVETMYDQNTGSYSLSASPTPRLRIRNDYGGDGIISSAQFFAKRGSGAASIFDIGVITTSTDYESNLIISSRNTDASYSEKIRIESAGQIRMNYGNNAKQAYVLRNTFRGVTGHSTTGYQYVRCALLGARTPYRCCISTQGGNYGPGAQFFTVLRSWDNTTLYVTDKLNIGSAYANAVRMQSDNGGGNFYLEISISLNTTSQGFNLNIIPLGNNAGSDTTAIQFYGSGMSNLTYTSSAQSL